MRILFVLSILLLNTYSLASDSFFIPGVSPSYVVIAEDVKSSETFTPAPIVVNNYQIKASTGSTSILSYTSQYFVNAQSRAYSFRDFNDATIRSDYNNINIYREAISNYYTISGSTAFSGSVLSGLAFGVSSGYEYFTDTGFVDIASPIRAAALMTGSSYIGMNAGIGAANVLVGTGSIVSGVLGEALGGIAAGSLFAVASYSVGSVSNVEARRMITKSVVGSSVASGVNLLLGTGFAVSSSSLGTLVLPYIAAIGATYSVNVIYKSIDRTEEIERLTYVLNRYR